MPSPSKKLAKYKPAEQKAQVDGIGSWWTWWAVGLGLSAVFVWSYWPTLKDLWIFWQQDPDYSVGQLVPLVAAYLVWAKRKMLCELPIRPCWWGLVVLLLSQAIRFCGLLFMYGSLERYSLIFAVLGIALLVLGHKVVRRLAWVFMFLLLLAPLPRRMHEMLSLPLQDFATTSATFGLELLGYLVAREGNVLRLGDQSTIAIVEACNGLRMLTAFVVVAAVLAFIVHRPRWQKLVIVLSGVPVAILANTFRLIVTVVVYETMGSETGEWFFHDLAGLTMMPIAIVVLALELKCIDWLTGGDTRNTRRVFRPHTRHPCAQPASYVSSG